MNVVEPSNDAVWQGARARPHKPGQQSRVILLAVIAYGVLLSSFLACLAIVVLGLLLHPSALTIRLVLIPAIAAVVIMKSLRVKFPPPAGMRLRDDEAPLLHYEIEQMRVTLSVPKIHEVYLNYEFNASVQQVPRLGVLGWHRNILSLGLPYLHTMSPEHFRATLAHELGHLSHRHGRLASWVYRIGESWEQTVRNLEQYRSIFTSPLRLFFRHFIPYFRSHTIALRRERELEADRLSAEAAGIEHRASGLINTRVQLMLADVINDRIDEGMTRSPVPDVSPLREAGELAKHETLSEVEFARMIEDEHNSPTTRYDSHPCLIERLEALGCEPRLPVPIGETAAEMLFGEDLWTVIDRFDADWRRDIAEEWQARYEQSQREKELLDELEGSAGELAGDDLGRYAMLVERSGDADKARSLYERLLEQEPDNPVALFHAGKFRLIGGQESGIVLLERAMMLDTEAVQPACKIVVEYLRKEGRDAEAGPYIVRWEAVERENERLGEECRMLSVNDDLRPASFSGSDLYAIREVLKGIRSVKRAYLIRKELGDRAGSYMHFLCLHLGGIYKSDNDVVDSVTGAIVFPETTTIVNLTKNTRLERKVKSVPDARIR